MRFWIFGSAEIKPDTVSKGIMAFTHSDMSHAGVIYQRSPFGPEMIVDSTGKGVTDHPLSDFLKTHRLVHRIDITQYVSSFHYALGWLEGNKGKEYSEAQYVGFVAGFMKRFVRDGESEMVCSEFAARFIDKCTALTCFKDADFDFINPKDCLEILTKAVA